MLFTCRTYPRLPWLTDHRWKWQDSLPGFESFAVHQVYSGSLSHQLFMSSNNNKVLKVSSWSVFWRHELVLLTKMIRVLLWSCDFLSGLLLRSLYYSNSHLGKPCPEGLDCPSFSTESWCNGKSQATRQSQCCYNFRAHRVYSFSHASSCSMAILVSQQLCSRQKYCSNYWHIHQIWSRYSCQRMNLSLTVTYKTDHIPIILSHIFCLVLISTNLSVSACWLCSSRHHCVTSQSC